jgi:hypothetical protein
MWGRCGSVCQAGHPWHTQWSCNRYWWLDFWGVESGGQVPRVVVRCEFLVSAPLLSRHHDELYTNWSCLTATENLNKSLIYYSSVHLSRFVGFVTYSTSSLSFTPLFSFPAILPSTNLFHKAPLKCNLTFSTIFWLFSLRGGDLLLQLLCRVFIRLVNIIHFVPYYFTSDGSCVYVLSYITVCTYS